MQICDVRIIVFVMVSKASKLDESILYSISSDAKYVDKFCSFRGGYILIDQIDRVKEVCSLSRRRGDFLSVRNVFF